MLQMVTAVAVDEGKMRLRSLATCLMKNLLTVDEPCQRARERVKEGKKKTGRRETGEARKKKHTRRNRQNPKEATHRTKRHQLPKIPYRSSQQTKLK